MKERSKKLLKIGGLAAALALIGGTFAFTNFGQRVLNITEDTNRPEHGARVHDYFQDDAATSNKDIFVENFGTEPVFVRVKLTELFMRNGLPVNANGELISEGNPATFNVEDPDTWPVFNPEVFDDSVGPGNVEFRAGGYRVDDNFLNDYFHLQLGQSGSGDDRPWYMPTFNFDPQSFESAAAGRAIDGETDGVTHPGDGTANFWGLGDTSFALPSMIGDPHNHSEEEHMAAQVLDQDHPPMTFAQWQMLDDEDQVGNFWVFDTSTGWAYWADFLGGATPGSAAGGQATSFLVDNKVRQAGLETINMDWTYKLHVMSGFAAATDQGIEDFAEKDVENSISTANMSVLLSALLEGNPSN